MAQEAEGPAKACKADRDKFCAGLTPGDGKLQACMKEHAADLSAECNAARQAMAEAWKDVRAKCKADAGKFCGDAGEKRGQLVKCLESHKTELDQACADALKERPGAKKA
jgi:hypothetical protein